MKSTEFTGVILAATCGARLYPLTSSKDDLDMNDEDSDDCMDGDNAEWYMPKHLLPLAGKPILHHLIQHCGDIGMNHVIIAISVYDDVTKNSLVSGIGAKEIEKDVVVLADNGDGEKKETEDGEAEVVTRYQLKYRDMDLSIMAMPSDCAGSADAIRVIQRQGAISDSSHVMVMPADLILYPKICCDDQHSNALGALADVHRREYRVGLKKEVPLAMSMLLADVGEEDENGIPLKESSKAKKGGIAREDEDIEYIGLATLKNKHGPCTQRIILKQSKYNVEEDEHNTGSTPKLHIQKARLHAPIDQIMIKTVWSDLHVFCFSPWTLKLLAINESMKDLGKEFVPFLVASQFRGLKASFGQRSGVSKDEDDEKMNALLEVMNELKIGNGRGIDDIGASRSTKFDEDSGQKDGNSQDRPFLVTTHILSRESSKLVLRACSLASYAYGCREIVSQAITASKVTTLDGGNDDNIKYEGGKLHLVKGTSVNTKFNSIILPDSTLGEKVQVKSSTIGRGVKIGKRCRLNNVVVHDNAVIGENCLLQNSVVSSNAIIGDNCNLNECQIRFNSNVKAGTKEKGEGL